MLTAQTREVLARRAKSTTKCFAVVGATGYAAFKLAAWKLSSYIEAYQQEIAANELVIGHFERARQQGKELMASFLPEFHEIITHRYNVDGLLEKLQADWIAELPSEQSREEKLRIWNQIKFEGRQYKE